MGHTWGSPRRGGEGDSWAAGREWGLCLCWGTRLVWGLGACLRVRNGMLVCALKRWWWWRWDGMAWGRVCVFVFVCQALGGSRAGQVHPWRPVRLGVVPQGPCKPGTVPQIGAA